MNQGESILIHNGTDNVGQAAINVCQHFGCQIYVTVDNEEKKVFLISEYNIPANRIFHSRDIQLKYWIMELTNGKGVDIVFNSLAGQLLEASECINAHGRLVEIDMHDLIQSGMECIGRDVSLIKVDVNSCLMECREFTIDFFDWMHRNAINNCIKPMKRIVFNANQVEKAFTYMTTGQHIGKVIISIRNEEIIKESCKPPPATNMIVSTRVYFNPNKVYILTGGLGGFALQLIQWMTTMGAKKFVLTSRCGFKNEYQKFFINRLVKYGEKLKYFKVDIKISKNNCLTNESTRHVMSTALKLGEIGGIFNLALILNDSLFVDMNYDKFCETIDAKHKVLDNFDIESRQLNYKLDYFVVFSSITSGKGMPGQTNYAIGNSLCERICEQRKSDGLHGLAIQFGPIADVGALATIRESLILLDYEDQSISSCLDIFGKCLSSHKPIITSYVSTVFANQFSP